MKRRAFLQLFTLLLVGTLTYFLYNNATVKLPAVAPNGFSSTGAPSTTSESDFPHVEPPTFSPVTVTTHPIRTLIEAESAKFEAVVGKQSKNLAEAVTEYKRRYVIPPPPNFDKWFEFAQKKGVVLMDEYDSIFESLRPFWALPPATIRARAREALGHDNFLIDVIVRDGRVTTKAEGWQQTATVGMMESFAQWLPDMDLAFNTKDEPRVVVPHEDMVTLLQMANARLSRIGSSSSSASTYRNNWSSKPSDLDYSLRAPEVKTTRFNYFDRQGTWGISRMSCPPDSPARSLVDTTDDQMSSYYSDGLALMTNRTAYSDICLTPSFAKNQGFFDRPNSFGVIHDLFPIFSQSKVSSFQDILYPSPWYWYHKVSYKQTEDMSWASKANKMYWRGSSTGGYSRAGSWRRHHRQNIVRELLSKASVRIFGSLTGPETADAKTGWSLTEAPREQYAGLFDVGFSAFGQCDKDDCREQETYFGMKPLVGQGDAWRYKYLLDIDGNAFSGRFYAFLQSMSAAFKVSIFREWHDGDNWIWPWVHYVPLSFSTHEYVEVMRYFDQEEEGKALIKAMATTSRKWASKALRNDDLEVWFFRLLLEYGRIIDDDRENIGFSVAASA